MSSKQNPKLQGQTVYGTITVTKDTIKVDVISDARANRIKKEIATRLGDSAKFRIAILVNVSTNIPEQGKDENICEMPDNVQESLRTLASARKKKWFDQPIPMLNGKSPREGSKTREGLKLLESLIETYSFNRGSRAESELINLFNPTEEEIRSELNL